MKNKKIFIPVFSLLILVCLFMNWAGDQLATRWQWPVWLDSVGTVLAAYMLGPWCGAMVGATFNLQREEKGRRVFNAPVYRTVVKTICDVVAEPEFAGRKLIVLSALQLGRESLSHHSDTLLCPVAYAQVLQLYRHLVSHPAS